jgi:photosystem II stability/assembly factor-like uncharacterized protein
MKKYIILLFILSICSISIAQNYQDVIRRNMDLPFHKIVDEVDAYFEMAGEGHESEYKQYQRWKYFNARRLDEEGRIQNVPYRLIEEFTDYRSRYQPPVDLNFDCTWKNVGGGAYQVIRSGHNGGLGRVNCITFDPDDPNTIYAGTPAGGVWRTSNGGGVWDPGTAASNWAPITDGLPNIGISGIAIDPTSSPSSRTLYILTGDGDGQHNPTIGVLKSYDGGESWMKTGLSWVVNDFVYGYKLLMHPTDPNTLFAATSNGIYKTEDAGLNWTLEAAAWFFDIEFKPGDPEIMYATTNNSFFRSDDGGDSWSPVSCGFVTTGIRMAIGVTPANPEVVYVLSGGTLLDNLNQPIAGTFRGIYRSADSGICFTLMTNSPNILDDQIDGSGTRQQSGYDLAIAVSPTNANEVHVGGINQWRSLDGGSTWALTAFWNENVAGAGDYNHADIHALEYNGATLYSGSDGGVYKTTNNADDWENISQGLKITQYYAIAAFTDEDISYAMGGTQDNGLNQLINTGSGFGNLQHWEGADGFECSPDFVNNFVYGATQNGDLVRYEYPDVGFTDIPDPPSAVQGAWLTPHVFDNGSGILFAGYGDVWGTPNSGGTWVNLSNGQIGGGLCSHIELAPSDPNNTWYVSKYLNPGSALFRTTDGGVTWTNITGTLPVATNVITYMAVNPTDPNQVWVTLGGFVQNSVEGYLLGDKVYFSPDGGANWENISGSLPNIPANCIVYQNGSNDGLYVGMDVGVYYRDDSMNDWVLFSNRLPNVIVSELDIDYVSGRIFAGTFGRGMWNSSLFSSCNRICLDCPEYKGLQSPSNVYSSENCIISSAVVYDDTEIGYEAEDFIRLKDGFRASALVDDAYFRARIQECITSSPAQSDVNYFTNSRRIPGYFIGDMPGLRDEADDTELVQSASPLLIYPNPTSGSFTLEMELVQEGACDILLYDVLGNLVKVFRQDNYLSQGLFRESFSVEELSNGTYFLLVRQGESRYHEPLIRLD